LGNRHRVAQRPIPAAMRAARTGCGRPSQDEGRCRRPSIPPYLLAATSIGGLNFFRSIVTFSRGSRPEFALRRPLEFRTVPSEAISMSGENSCFSRFLVKFVEVSGAGRATAISAYALAHLGGLLSSSPTPPSAPATAVQVNPIAS